MGLYCLTLLLDCFFDNLNIGIKMENKRVKILVLFTTLSLLTTIIGATFSYFTAVREEKTITPLKVYTYSQDMTTSTATNVLLFVPSYKMNQGKGRNDYSQFHRAPVPGEIIIKTSVGSLGGINTCTYDLVYLPKEINGAYYKSSSNTFGYKELVLELEAIALDENVIITKGENVEIDITDVDEELTLVQGATLSVEGEVATGRVKWEIYPKIYNLGINQTDRADQMFGGSIYIKNLVCDNT